jgi:hypothetical protein
MNHLDLPVGVLVHRERVDHANAVGLTQALQLRDDLAVEVRLRETEHDQLNRSGTHMSPSPSGRATSRTAGAASVTEYRRARLIHVR